MSNDKRLTSGGLARLAGVSRNTVVNYTRAGILAPITLSDRTRVYGLADIDRVREIAASRKRKREGEGGSG